MTTVSSADRLGFTLFMAAAVHAVIVLGLSFGLEDKAPPPKTLEVTLATYKSQKKPEDADFLAQLNQQGSGTLEKKATPTTDRKADIQDNKINEVELQPQEAAAPKTQAKKTPQVVTRAESDKKVQDSEVIDQPTPDQPNKAEPRQHIDLRQEIASLEAQLSDQRQEYAKRPRVKRLTAASTMLEPGAAYKNAWRQKVERIGNLNYPAQARQQKLYGELRLMVAINRDGTLSNVEILKSSGYNVLDDAAIRIVRLAAPYAPFTDDLRDYDMVEIIRTWRFEKGDRLFSQ
ncbi:energy transducer TonB [Endozoicomonas arenosclerae]|uniref:energy transducer TonB n=1 Tax=Endozoicomonas arenosclerae TaxID=1633495 RepID=UPI0007825662|nr:energy transducer TonB [Endozoicomonas arenosclerae]